MGIATGWVGEGFRFRGVLCAETHMRLTLSQSMAKRRDHEKTMARTRVSAKYQVVIPKEIRESMNLKVGQELQVVAKGGMITLVPEQPLSGLRGFAKKIRTENIREKRDRM